MMDVVEMHQKGSDFGDSRNDDEKGMLDGNKDMQHQLPHESGQELIDVSGVGQEQCR